MIMSRNDDRQFVMNKYALEFLEAYRNLYSIKDDDYKKLSNRLKKRVEK